MSKKHKDKEKDKVDSVKKKNTSLRLEKKTLKALKVIAIEEDTSVQNIIEKLIEDFLKQREGAPVSEPEEPAPAPVPTPVTESKPAPKPKTKAKPKVAKP
jgi:hypothetical protein